MDNSTNPQIRAACLLAAALAEDPVGLAREDVDGIVAAIQSLLIEIHQGEPDGDYWYEIFQAWEDGTHLHEMFGLDLQLDREV